LFLFAFAIVHLHECYSTQFFVSLCIGNSNHYEDGVAYPRSRVLISIKQLVCSLTLFRHIQTKGVPS